MSEVNQSPNDLDKAGGCIIAILILPIALVVAIPAILYHALIETPIGNLKRKKFFERNEGKIILCITTSTKYNFFKNHFMNDLRAIGISDVVVFDGQISNNTYDNYDWDQLITRENGFPLLLQIRHNGIMQQSLKADFQAFFKKEIHLTQLISIIKLKMIHT